MNIKKAQMSSFQACLSVWNRKTSESKTTVASSAMSSTFASLIHPRRALVPCDSRADPKKEKKRKEVRETHDIRSEHHSDWSLPG